MTPKRVQTVMGQANITMTMDMYGHLFPDPKGDRKRWHKSRRGSWASVDDGGGDLTALSRMLRPFS